MLSLQQSKEIRESLLSYLKATFTFRKKSVATAFDDFMTDPTHGMFKGPYLSLKLRFVKADAEATEKVPLMIKPDWSPYDHQVKSWERLSTQEQEPRATIVTTGTGSGKTECFMYPVLDYCYRQQRRNGIKVIILYPMNALATDQAKRLAEAIHSDERLKGEVRAGLFIGEGAGGGKINYPQVMGESNIVENRDTILDTPPDILLTNFKMLDYALMKAEYHRLWKHNLEDSQLLKFLVLDELHTYDGAQGTDVANLIRRLKLKLNLPATGQLCPIGTSATIGSGENASQYLSEYASKIYGEPIDTSAIITENRITPEEFFGTDDGLEDFLPRLNRLKDIDVDIDRGFDTYLDQHYELWQLDKKQLAKGLKKLKVVKDLADVCSKGVLTIESTLRDLSVINDSFKKTPQWDDENQYSPKERMLESLLTVIAAAKDIENSKTPFMYMQVQLWVRELSGVQYTLEDNPKFSFRDRVDAQSDVIALPPWYCRECSSSGWLGAMNDNGDRFSKDVNEIYEKFFSNNKNVYFMLPDGTLEPQDLELTGYEPDDFERVYLNRDSLRVVDSEEEGMPLQIMRKHKDNRAEHVCPNCNSQNTISIIGTKVPTLSSISVSQTLATDLDYESDKYRKVLAFTNSVQDAAHHAGFIEARNYRFSLRTAIQRVVNLQEGPIRLNDLCEAFFKYWKNNSDEKGKNHLGAFLYRFYPKDYIGKSSPESYYNNGTYKDSFLKEFDTRLRWEIYSEFGFNSIIGRTLEKTGTSAACFDDSKLTEVWSAMKVWLEVNDVSQTIEKNDFINFAHLLLHRVRSRGAIDHSYLNKFRTAGFSLWDLNWMRDTRHFLNPYFGPRSRLPKLLTSGDRRKGLLDSTTTDKQNWFHVYFIKTFKMASTNTSFINDFYEELLKKLAKAGVLKGEKAGDQYSYTINPEAILINKNVDVYECSKCGHTLYLKDDEKKLEYSPCTEYRCTGEYKFQHQKANNYYKQVYNRKRSPRIYASEHTGLLQRDVREELENDFKQRRDFNSCNTLVATSTLEMGIDIGSLNTAYNNSIPPLPSNFMQRVGRAGRSSGSALVVNFATNKPHDLYYYEDPLEMMQGDVNTPGCYLEAKDILRRHFMAYCIDSWTSSNSDNNRIPPTIRMMKLNSADLDDNNFFANRINQFIRDNKKELIDSFLNHYDDNIKENVFKKIGDDLNSGLFYDTFLKVFLLMRDEMRDIKKLRENIDKEVKKLKYDPKDPTYMELKSEMKNMGSLLNGILERNTIEHLTNVGILPNYAFPEAGVRLNATVKGNKAEEAYQTSLDKEFEIVRSANQAIREFAPQNFFYTQGFRFEISGLNVFDWSEENNNHEKRFCSRCDHLEVNGLTDYKVCPKCGDPSWGSNANVHQYVKLTSVRSFTNESKARLNDASDDRESLIYNTIDHVSFSGDTDGALVLKDYPFGIEFLRGVNICTVNYGRADASDGRNIKVNEQDISVRGFVTCRHCGKSFSKNVEKRNNGKNNQHYSYCKHRDKEYSNAEDDVFKEIYLFREVETEVLKVVLPIQDINKDSDLSMFQAGVELGLKRYFRGNPSHIRIMPYREYNKKIDKFDMFLLLYDTIPGGTGYLEQLYNAKEFSELLNLSYIAIRDCDCQKIGKDGCYKCIFSYSNQRMRASLSRERAEKWFETIVAHSDAWEERPEGLTSVTESGRIEESELEERFVRLLSKWAADNKSWTFNEEKDRGVFNYRLSKQTYLVNIEYSIRPQVPLGKKDGIPYSTRPDFLISCIGYNVEGKEYRDEVKDIALYLDGYQYHASASSENTFEKDINIRTGIAGNPRYMTWTLTWNDLSLFETTGKEGEFEQLFKSDFAGNYRRLIKTVRGNAVIYADKVSNMRRLLQLLEFPLIKLHINSWYAYLASFTEEFLKPSYDPNLKKELIAGQKIKESNYIQENKNFDSLIRVDGLPTLPFVRWKTWVNMPKYEVHNILEYIPCNEIDREQWELFWSFFNIFQSGEYHNVIEEDKVELVELLALYDELLHPLFTIFWEKNWINTHDDTLKFECIMNEDGDSIAEAELIIPQLKIVVAPSSDKCEEYFKENGYSFYEMENLDKIEVMLNNMKTQ